MGEGLGPHFHALLFDIVGKPGHQVDDEACHARARQVSHVLRPKHSPAMRACVQADEGRGGRRGGKGGKTGTEDEGLLKSAPAAA